MQALFKNLAKREAAAGGYATVNVGGVLIASFGIAAKAESFGWLPHLKGLTRPPAGFSSVAAAVQHATAFLLAFVAAGVSSSRMQAFLVQQGVWAWDGQRWNKREEPSQEDGGGGRMGEGGGQEEEG